MLICIEKCDRLKAVMKQAPWETKFTCLNQAEKLNGRISFRERDREVKCFHRVLEVRFSAEGDALGDIACQGGLNADGLYHHQS